MEQANSTKNVTPHRKKMNWWIRISLYAVSVVAAQAAVILLRRQYYNEGGKSKWMASLVQIAGFPILIPFYIFSPLRNSGQPKCDINGKPPPAAAFAAVYVSLGLLMALTCYVFSIGAMYLPVSTFSLIWASQLGFNALFSYFLNSQKFTPFTVNSLVLLTLSSTLLVFDGGSSNTGGIPRGKYVIGFICTGGASIVFGLFLSLTQFSFNRVIKRQNFAAVIEMVLYQSMVATAAILIGLFASGEWKDLEGEMKGYKLGEISYLMNLIWTAISRQVFNIGAVGLIFEVSSLFSNAISAVGIPVIPVLAVVFFGDEFEGVKVVALILAIWGFVSYIYQHYLEDRNESIKIEAQAQAQYQTNV